MIQLHLKIVIITQDEHVMIKKLLELLIGEIDAKLLKAVEL